MRDLTGASFGLWTVLSYAGGERWNCRCRCGKEKSVQRSGLVSGRTRSCGCMKNTFRAQSMPQFWDKLERVSALGCWVWTGVGNNSGYGLTSYYGRKNLLVHRLAYELFHGPIPEDQEVCHDCPGGDNKRCCNPDHLYLGTRSDNMQDAVKKGQLPLGQDRLVQAKLTNEDVQYIRSFRAIGIRLKDLAEMYGVSESLISGIARGVRWKHIEGSKSPCS